MKKLLLEYKPFNYDPSKIEESMKRHGGKFIVEGPLQRAGAKNQNGRIYPRPILEREVSRYMNSEIKENRALGELDHPDDSVVNLKNVSHNVIGVEWRGDDVWGKVEVLNTPSGKILQELFKSGVTLGISSRGMGSVNQLDENTVEVQDDFQLVCWDFVSNPSTHGAFMSPIQEGISNNIKYSKNYSNTHKLITEIVCELSGICCV